MKIEKEQFKKIVESELAPFRLDHIKKPLLHFIETGEIEGDFLNALYGLIYGELNLRILYLEIQALKLSIDERITFKDSLLLSISNLKKLVRSFESSSIENIKSCYSKSTNQINSNIKKTIDRRMTYHSEILKDELKYLIRTELQKKNKSWKDRFRRFINK